MRDQNFATLKVESRETLGLKLPPLSIEVPMHHDVGIALANRLNRQPRRKRRNRPATERFHGRIGNQ